MPPQPPRVVPARARRGAPRRRGGAGAALAGDWTSRAATSTRTRRAHADVIGTPAAFATAWSRRSSRASSHTTSRTGCWYLRGRPVRGISRGLYEFSCRKVQRGAGAGRGGAGRASQGVAQDARFVVVRFELAEGAPLGGGAGHGLGASAVPFCAGARGIPTRVTLGRVSFAGERTAVAVFAAREAALARTVGRLRLSARSQGALRPVHGSFA